MQTDMYDDPRLTAYIFDEMTPDERALFEQELQDNSVLKADLEAFRQLLRSVDQHLRQEPALSLSADRLTALQRTFSGESTMLDQVEQMKQSPAHANLWKWWAIAASLLLVVVSGAYIRQSQMLTLASNQKLTPQENTVDAIGLVRKIENAKLQAEIETVQEELSDSAANRLSIATTVDISESMASGTGVVESNPEPRSFAAQSNEAATKNLSSAVTSVPSPSPIDRQSSSLAMSKELQAEKNMSGSVMGGPMTGDAKGTGYAAVGAVSDVGGYGIRDESIVAGGYPNISMRLSESSPLSIIPSRADLGRGPGNSGDRYDPIIHNPFLRVKNDPLSTFSIDVDTASYSKIRMSLKQFGQLPRPDAVRIEELVNYFTYDYAAPKNDSAPFSADMEVSACPWRPEHRLARIAIKGKDMSNAQRPLSNLVFLVDVSGSMNDSNKLPLVKQGLLRLVTQLGENDRVAIVVYAGAAGLVLDSTSADNRSVIEDALSNLAAGGSTNGGEGIRLAYNTARENFIKGGTNRVILCSDGDFNVGTTGTDELVRLVEEEAGSGIFLTVLGYGMGNHNDAMMEQISGRGNGNYAFIDTPAEADKVLVEQLAGTLVTIAKDVKIQIEFNPQKVEAYRLLGYENRILAAQDFNDDTKDAGEIGAGHTVTAFYEIVPAVLSKSDDLETGSDLAPEVDPLKYQRPATLAPVADSNELLTLKLRYKDPDGDESQLLEFPIDDSEKSINTADEDFRFASSVAAFGMVLRDSPYRGEANLDLVLEIANSSLGEDKHGLRKEFVELVERAQSLMPTK